MRAVGERDGHGPEAVLVAGAGEERQEPVGPGVGRDVPVVGGDPAHQVPHAAAHEMGLVPGGAERARDRPDAIGDRGSDAARIERSQPAGRQFTPRKR